MFIFIFGSIAILFIIVNIVVFRPLRQELSAEAIQELVDDVLFYCDTELENDHIVKDILVEQVEAVQQKVKEKHNDAIFAYKELDNTLTRLENSTVKSFNLTSVSIHLLKT